MTLGVELMLVSVSRTELLPVLSVLMSEFILPCRGESVVAVGPGGDVAPEGGVTGFAELEEDLAVAHDDGGVGDGDEGLIRWVG